VEKEKILCRARKGGGRRGGLTEKEIHISRLRKKRNRSLSGGGRGNGEREYEF